MILATVVSLPSRAQGTAPVSPLDAAYRDVERLDQLGVLDSVIVGQRPFSRRELGRLVRIARRRAVGLRPDMRVAAEDVLARLEARIAPAAPLAALIDEASVSVVQTNARRRGLAGNVGSRAETTIEPLVLRRFGATPAHGGTLALEVAHAVEPTLWLAVNVRERIEFRALADPGISRVGAEVLLGGVRARRGNLAIMAGREQLAWALGEHEGLFLASDAPALDQISLSGDQPFLFPSFLARLGPSQATIVLADLGPSVVRSHSRLLAYKLSIRPGSAVELGAIFMNHFGGEGARPSSISDRLIDFLPLIDIFRRHNYFDSTRTLDVDSDKTLGVDARLRLRHAGGMIVAGEWLVDDFDASALYRLVTTYGSQSITATLPALGTPALSLTLQAKHKGIYTSTHGTLRNGMTTRGRLLGDELGSDAKSFGGVLRWIPSRVAEVTLEARHTSYGNAIYQTGYSDPARTQFEIQKVSHLPDEMRDYAVASYLLHLGTRSSVTARAAGELIRNPVVPEVGRRRYIVEFLLTTRP